MPARYYRTPGGGFLGQDGPAFLDGRLPCRVVAYDGGPAFAGSGLPCKIVGHDGAPVAPAADSCTRAFLRCCTEIDRYHVPPAAFAALALEPVPVVPPSVRDLARELWQRSRKLITRGEIVVGLIPDEECAAAAAALHDLAEDTGLPAWLLLAATPAEMHEWRLTVQQWQRSLRDQYQFRAGSPYIGSGTKRAMVLYVSNDLTEVTTWVGHYMGRIVHAGDEYETPAGGWGRGGRYMRSSSTRISIRVEAINGRLYSGTYYQSSGNYCRLRLCKNNLRAKAPGKPQKASAAHG